MNFIEFNIEELRRKIIVAKHCDRSETGKLILKLSRETMEEFSNHQVNQIGYHFEATGSSLTGIPTFVGIPMKIDNTLKYGEIKLIREYF